MRRLLLFILICWPLLFSGTICNVVVGGVAAPADDYSDILFWWTCESANISTGDYSAGDTSGEVDSDAVFSASAMKLGTNGLSCPTAWDSVTFSIGDPQDIILGSEGRIGFWFYADTLINDQILFYAVFDADNEIIIRYWTADASPCGSHKTGGTNHYYTGTGASMATGNWYFIEYAWKQSTNYRQCWVNGTSCFLDSSTTYANITATGGTIQIGQGGVGTGAYFDNVIISSDSTRNLYLLSGTDNYPGS